MNFSIAPAHASLQWLGLALQTIFRNPLAFLLLAGLLRICHLLLCRIPFVGIPLSAAIEPFTILIMLIVVARASSGHRSTSALLWSGLRAFRGPLRGLLVLCAVRLTLFLLALTLLSALCDQGFAYRHLQGHHGLLEGERHERLLAWLDMLVLPPAALLAFAPALVHWHGLSPLQAMGTSAAACLRNWRAILQLILVQAFVMQVAIRLLTWLMESMPAINESAPQAVVDSLGFICSAVFSISWFFAFRTLFSGARPAPTAPPGDRLPCESRAVPARNGLRWLQMGFRTFRRQPLVLGLGLLLFILFVPFAVLLVMVVTAQADRGAQSTRAVLQAAGRALRQDFWRLLRLGALYVGIGWLVLGITFVVGAGVAARLSELSAQADAPIALAMLALAAMVLLALATLQFWHAPGLIHWQRLSPLQALKCSSHAVRLNWRAFSLFFVLWGLIYAACCLPLFMLMKLPAPGSFGLVDIAKQVIICVAHVLHVIFMSCIYFSYRDCFALPGSADSRAD